MNSLIWADDLLLLSESKKGFDNTLRNLNNYTKGYIKSNLRVNLEKKTNYMNKCEPLMRGKFMFGDDTVKMTGEYKYLGCLLTPLYTYDTGA